MSEKCSKCASTDCLKFWHCNDLSLCGPCAHKWFAERKWMQTLSGTWVTDARERCKDLEAEVARLTKRLGIAETSIGLCSGSCHWYMGAIYEEGVYQGQRPPIALDEAMKLKSSREKLIAEVAKLKEQVNFATQKWHEALVRVKEVEG